MGGIDRRALVSRHDVEVEGIDPTSPLSVGNGEFCVTVDVTGLQSLPAEYPVADPSGGPDGTLLATQAQWGWHSLPGGDFASLDTCRRRYATERGPVPYVDLDGDLADVDTAGASGPLAWLRGNPHRLDLARIGFAVTAPDGEGEVVSLQPDDLSEARQRLDLWGGVLDSRFVLGGCPVGVRTACHPDDDVLAVRVRSSVLSRGLAVRVAFPYGSAAWGNAADWTRPEAHRTEVTAAAGGWLVRRELDGTRYEVRIAAWPGTRIRRLGPHDLLLTTDRDDLGVSLAFSPGPTGPTGPGGPGGLRDDGDGPDGGEPPGVAEVERASRRHWAAFWSGGGAVDLSGSTDGRAGELERRVVLSQYLTAVNCAGSLPPAESGLTGNSWRGRFHLEMHWWHAAHFATWGRPDLLERSLAWYAEALPAARVTAQVQGYDGVRWPKQAGPDGRETPSPIGPFLVWQQPHPIHLAELVRRARAVRGGDGAAEVVERYAPLVLASAAFMASFATRTGRGFELGPPVVPAQECYATERRRLRNPAFELAYWRWGLRVASGWRRLLGLDPDPSWDAVADGLVPPPRRDGRLAAVETASGEPWTLRVDHPSMLYALGMVPATGFADPDDVRRTLADVLADWDWDSTWGWDFPALAMTAARVGDPAAAVDALLLPVAKNRHVASGHVRQGAALPVYLPGNGGLLAAVALMAAGWDGGPPRPAPGFPAEGWHVVHEGLVPSP